MDQRRIAIAKRLARWRRIEQARARFQLPVPFAMRNRSILKRQRSLRFFTDAVVPAVNLDEQPGRI